MTPAKRYCAIIEYDGTDFFGFQLQSKERTVQGEIEKGLGKLGQGPIQVTGAGRTDAGVHATGQVISFTINWRHDTDSLQRAINANLPPDVKVRTVNDVTDPHFHPRFSAISRTYHYKIINQPWPSPIRRHYAYQVPESLNVADMQQASHYLLGNHDFAAFGKPTQGESTVRHVMQADWFVDEQQQLKFVITANAFLYRMVRRIVSTLIQVGLGKMPIEDIDTILKARNLQGSTPPAPACGLYLVKVSYCDEI